MTTNTFVRDSITHSPDFIAFRTKGAFSAHDLRRLTTSVETVYGVFLALDFLGGAASDPTDPRRALIDYYDLQLRSFLTKGWRFQQGGPPEAFSRFVRDRALRTDFDREATRFLELLREAPYRWMPEAELRVRTIVMRSPGYISFEGAGDFIKQIRHLIKDISFRNRQEKQAGDIKLAAALRALEALPISSPVRGAEMADNATLLLEAGMDELFQLEEEGKLEQLDLFMDKDESQS
jgi:hypothetical protein